MRIRRTWQREWLHDARSAAQGSRKSELPLVARQSATLLPLTITELFASTTGATVSETFATIDASPPCVTVVAVSQRCSALPAPE